MTPDPTHEEMRQRVIEREIRENLDEGVKGMRVLADVLLSIGCKKGSQQAAEWADRMAPYAKAEPQP